MLHAKKQSRKEDRDGELLLQDSGAITWCGPFTWCGPPGPQTRAQRGVKCARDARTESHAKKQRRKEDRNGELLLKDTWCYYVVRPFTWCGPPGPQTRAQRGVKIPRDARTIARSAAQENRSTIARTAAQENRSTIGRQRRASTSRLRPTIDTHRTRSVCNQE